MLGESIYVSCVWKKKKSNIRVFDFWITKYWYQSYKYQSIKIIYDQIVNQLPFHVTFFTACILCYSDVLWIFFTETFQSSDFKVSWEICTLLWWRRRRKLFKCSASAQPDGLTCAEKAMIEIEMASVTPIARITAVVLWKEAMVPVMYDMLTVTTNWR